MEATLTLSLEGTSLQQSIAEGEETILEIKKIAEDYCKNHAKDKAAREACKSAMEVSEF